MTCWKWFGSVLKEAGVEVTDKNQKKVDDVIHQYIGVSSTRGDVSRKTPFSSLAAADTDWNLGFDMTHMMHRPVGNRFLAFRVHLVASTLLSGDY